MIESTVVETITLMLSFSSMRLQSAASPVRYSRFWTTYTVLQSSDNCNASTKAEFPPPITATSWSLKKAPSQTAQKEIPSPMNCSSFSIPKCLCLAPVAIITALDSNSPESVTTVLISPSFTSSASQNSNSTPWDKACSTNLSANSLPEISVKPGIFSTFGENVICPPKTLFSITSTVFPARLAYMEEVSPAGPPPITIISYIIFLHH